MQKDSAIPTSIYGKAWANFRKWFYAAWLIYETVFRFYDYAHSTYTFTLEQTDRFGSLTSEVLATSSGLLCFLICAFFLTVPTTYLIFTFFEDREFIQNPNIQKLRYYL